MNQVSHLDDGDHIGCGIGELAAVNVEMGQLIPLCALVDQTTASSHGMNAPEVSCRIEGGVWWGW